MRENPLVPGDRSYARYNSMYVRGLPVVVMKAPKQRSGHPGYREKGEIRYLN